MTDTLIEWGTLHTADDPFEKIWRDTQANKGGTWDAASLEPFDADSGYVIAYPGSTELPVSKAGPDDIRAYATTIEGPLFGTWIDEGTLYLETSEHYPVKEEEAFDIARGFGQMAIYDCGSKSVVTVPEPHLGMRLGASVEENALATIADIMGSNPYGVPSMEGGKNHKPARADIQKMKGAYDAFNKTYDSDGGTTGEPANPEGAQEWDQKYGLNSREQLMVMEYKSNLQNYGDPKTAFDATIAALDRDEVLGLPNIDDPELKKMLGGALKKYEQQNYPMLYGTIRKSLDDAYRTNHESYKLWPKMVQWIKDDFQHWLWHTNNSFNSENQSPGSLDADHIVDVTTAGGAVLSQLRANHSIPQNFDVNQLDFNDFEKWFMDWKKENRASEAQGEVVYEFHDGSTIQKLTTPEQLQFEGDEMGHCVGDYSQYAGSGQVAIYSLRDKKGNPHVTMEIVANQGEDGWVHPDSHEPDEDFSGYKDFEVIQVQGNSNNTPKPEYQRKIKEFLDALRAKGWNFDRSSEWYHNYDDPMRGGGDEYVIEDRGGYNSYKGMAGNLDDWYDDHYKTKHNSYRGRSKDPYGMTQEQAQLYVKDWDELMQDAVGSLINNYDQGKWRGHAEDLAQAVYHAYMIRTGPKTETADKLKADALELIQNTEGKLYEWDWTTWEYAMQDLQHTDIDTRVKDIAEKHGVWDQIEQKLDTEFGEGEWYGGQLLDEVQAEHLDVWEEAIDEVRDEVQNEYSGDAHKFLNYLYQLIEKRGVVNPKDLPDPNERHGGLPSYEEIQEMPWPETPKEEIPGTFSSWREAGDDFKGDDFMHDPDDPGRSDDENFVPPVGSIWTIGDPWANTKNPPAPPMRTVEVADVEAQYVWFKDLDTQVGKDQADGISLTMWNKWMSNGRIRHKDADWNFQESPEEAIEHWPDTMPEHWAATEYQIHPIDEEHNVWFDEDGNERQRWRPGWARGDNGKMQQTGEPEDVFLDKQGRQGAGYVAYHGDRPVGSLTYVDDPAGWYMLGTAYTHPDYREQGVFNQLVSPLRETGKPIDAYVWNNQWLKNKVRGWMLPKKTAAATKIIWVDTSASRTFNNLYNPDYGLPFLYEPNNNVVYIGTTPTYHNDLVAAASVPGDTFKVLLHDAWRGRYNQLTHQPSYPWTWSQLPSGVRMAVEDAVAQKFPLQEGQPETEAPADWDQMLAKTAAEMPPRVHWVDTEGGLAYAEPDLPSYGLPFIYNPERNEIHVGTTPTYHSTTRARGREQGFEVAPYGGEGRFNELTHQGVDDPNSRYGVTWKNMPPMARQELRNQVAERYPYQEPQEIPAQEGDWDTMLAKTAEADPGAWQYTEPEHGVKVFRPPTHDDKLLQQAEDQGVQLNPETRPTLHWINTEGKREYEYPGSPTYGLPFIHDFDDNTIHIGTTPAYHEDLYEEGGEHEYDYLYGNRGRINPMTHEPASGYYRQAWLEMSPLEQETLMNAIKSARHPTGELRYPLEQEEAPEEEEGNWDEMLG